MAHDQKMSSLALSELEDTKTDAKQTVFRETHLKELVEIFVIAMSHNIYSTQRLNRFAIPLEAREIGIIVSRTKRRLEDK